MEHLTAGSVWKLKESYVDSTTKYYAWAQLTSVKKAREALRRQRVSVLYITSSTSGQDIVKYQTVHDKTNYVASKPVKYFLEHLERASEQEQPFLYDDRHMLLSSSSSSEEDMVLKTMRSAIQQQNNQRAIANEPKPVYTHEVNRDVQFFTSKGTEIKRHVTKVEGPFYYFGMKNQSRYKVYYKTSQAEDSRYIAANSVEQALINYELALKQLFANY